MCVVCASLCVTVWCENSGVKWEEGNAVKAHGAGGAPEVMTALAFWTSSEAVGISVGTSPAPFVNGAPPSLRLIATVIGRAMLN